jgi:hypothetical protein
LQDLYPGAIDFLGTYSGSDQTITIYLGSIDRFLGTEQGRGLDREAVIEVVRIHEAMHWLHHLGSVATARARLWEPLDSNLHPDFEIERDALFAKPTNIQKFVDTRTRWWESLGIGLFNKVWEFVAEVSTCIYANYVQQVHGPRLAGKPSLRNTFWQMAQNQPPEYDILPPLRDTLKEPGSWPETGGLFRLWLRKSWERQLRLAPTEYETNYSEAGLIK